MADWQLQPAHDLPDGLVPFDGACAMCDASPAVRRRILTTPEDLA